MRIFFIFVHAKKNDDKMSFFSWLTSFCKISHELSGTEKRLQAEDKARSLQVQHANNIADGIEELKRLQQEMRGQVAVLQSPLSSNIDRDVARRRLADLNSEVERTQRDLNVYRSNATAMKEASESAIMFEDSRAVVEVTKNLLSSRDASTSELERLKLERAQNQVLTQELVEFSSSLSTSSDPLVERARSLGVSPDVLRRSQPVSSSSRDANDEVLNKALELLGKDAVDFPPVPSSDVTPPLQHHAVYVSPEPTHVHGH